METLGPEVTGFLPAHLAESVLFDDRADAGQRLARALPSDFHDPLVVGTTRGGVEIGAEVAAALHAPLDVVVVSPVRRSPDSDSAAGAVTPGEDAYLREPSGLSPVQAVVAVARAHHEAAHVDALLHERRRQLPVEGHDLVLVDEAITTGTTMAAAIKWGRAKSARRIVAAVPVGARAGLELVRTLADGLVCLYEFEVIGARAVWFGDLPPLADEDVRQLLEARR